MSPEHRTNHPGVGYTEEPSRNAGKLFRSLLLISAVALFAIVKMPGGAPFVLLALYFFFHRTLRRRWTSLGDLPAALADGRAWDSKVRPWFFNRLARACFPRLREQSGSRAFFHRFLFTALAWDLVPPMLLFSWVQLLCRYDTRVTTGIGIVLAMAVWLAAVLYYLVIITLRPDDPAAFPWRIPRSDRPRRFPLRDVGTAFLHRAGRVIAILLLLFHGFSLEGTEFTQAELNGADLRRADLRGVRLVQVEMYGADLRDADFRGADLGQARFSGADLSGAQFNVADLGQVDFNGAILRHADLRGANLTQAGFKGADLKGADLRGANLTQADFEGADLNGVKLDGWVRIETERRSWLKPDAAHLREPGMGGADLHDADLEGAVLRGASLPGRDLREAHLNGADLAGADLRDADLTGADLNGADLRGADLRGANLSRAELNGSRLRGARLSRALLHGAEFKGADLAQAECTGALYDKETEWPYGFGPENRGARRVGERVDIQEDHRNGADFRRADLRGIDFSQDRLNGANLSQADLRMGRFVQAELNGADLSGAFGGRLFGGGLF